jgi:hypothetical protein
MAGKHRKPGCWLTVLAALMSAVASIAAVLTAIK